MDALIYNVFLKEFYLKHAYGSENLPKNFIFEKENFIFEKENLIKKILIYNYTLKIFKTDFNNENIEKFLLKNNNLHSFSFFIFNNNFDINFGFSNGTLNKRKYDQK
jgi:hypothetical protein